MKIFNRVYSNVTAAREAWREHFHNRSPKDVAASNVKLEIRNLVSGEVEILLYDEIGFWGVTAKEFVAALAGITANQITVRINSPGGDVFDGLAIYNALKAHPATIKTNVEGLAASAASFIALAGDTVNIAPAAFMMIHKAWGFAIGNADDFRDMVVTLDKIDGQLADIYAKKTGKTKDEMLALMKGEADGTWFTADEAKALGLVDAVTGDAPAADETVDPDTNKPAPPAPEARVSAMRRRLALAHHDD
jgi:ATP-dependent Clp endopeptidase proteolytic subunit ClpP